MQVHEHLNNFKMYSFYVSLSDCKEGWYGVNCSQQCVGYCRDGSTCHHVTGQCNEGCAAGWTGSLCKKGKCVYCLRTVS